MKDRRVQLVLVFLAGLVVVATLLSAWALSQHRSADDIQFADVLGQTPCNVFVKGRWLHVDELKSPPNGGKGEGGLYKQDGQLWFMLTPGPPAEIDPLTITYQTPDPGDEMQNLAKDLASVVNEAWGLSIKPVPVWSVHPATGTGVVLRAPADSEPLAILYGELRKLRFEVRKDIAPGNPPGLEIEVLPQTPGRG